MVQNTPSGEKLDYNARASLHALISLQVFESILLYTIMIPRMALRGNPVLAIERHTKRGRIMVILANRHSCNPFLFVLYSALTPLILFQRIFHYKSIQLGVHITDHGTTSSWGFETQALLLRYSCLLRLVTPRAQTAPIRA